MSAVRFRPSIPVLLVHLAAATACTKDTAATAPPASKATGDAPAPGQEGRSAPGDAKVSADEALRARLAEALERARADAEKERARWNDDLVRKTRALLARSGGETKAVLEAALASPHRRPGHAARDRYRHPLEVAAFFGLRPDMTVVEVGAGAGWWTELFAVVLYEEGKLVLPSFAEDDPDPRRAYFGARDALLLSSAPVLYERVERFVQPPGETVFGPPGSADMVIVFRMLHNWHRSGTFETNAKAAYEVLKPGGILAVIQHRAPAGADPDTWADKGYLPEAYVVEALGKAGFELLARSEVNANPKDTKDYPEGVWTLPPTLALGEKDRDRYLAIGESDRMTLKLRKKAP